MYRYDLNIISKEHAEINGKAIDIRIIDDREFLILDSDGCQLKIEINQIKSVNVLSPHARFEKIAC